MNLLLTGATGFVGRNALLRALPGYGRIFAPVRSEAKLRSQLSGEGVAAENVVALGADPATWGEAAPDHAILGAGVLFARDRQEYFETNVDWKLRVIEALPETCRIVVLSSQSAGGPTPEGCATRSEDDADAPITWYGESKLAMEQAIRERFPHRPIIILRPPMILGPRDQATLPLFKMGAGLVRLKPAWHTKSYSFIAVQDLVEAIFLALAADSLPDRSLYVAAPEPITDWQLIASAVQPGKTGLTLPVPQPAVRLLSAVVDAVPALRAQTPSLTRDRAREIWPPRWVVDGGRFDQWSGWSAKRGLVETMRETADFYRRTGQL